MLFGLPEVALPSMSVSKKAAGSVELYKVHLVFCFDKYETHIAK